jgi:hypothetical protein
MEKAKLISDAKDILFFLHLVTHKKSYKNSSRGSQYNSNVRNGGSENNNGVAQTVQIANLLQSQQLASKKCYQTDEEMNDPENHPEQNYDKGHMQLQTEVAEIEKGILPDSEEQ